MSGMGVVGRVCVCVCVRNLTLPRMQAMEQMRVDETHLSAASLTYVGVASVPSRAPPTHGAPRHLGHLQWMAKAGHTLPTNIHFNISITVGGWKVKYLGSEGDYLGFEPRRDDHSECPPQRQTRE